MYKTNNKINLNRGSNVKVTNQQFIETLPPKEHNDTFLYGVDGKFVDDEKLSICMKKNGGFYLRTSNAVADKGAPYNPWSVMPMSMNFAGATNFGEPIYVWSEVNEFGYNSYLMFLSSRNPLHYRNAQRNTL